MESYSSQKVGVVTVEVKLVEVSGGDGGGGEGGSGDKVGVGTGGIQAWGSVSFQSSEVDTEGGNAAQGT